MTNIIIITNNITSSDSTFWTAMGAIATFMTALIMLWSVREMVKQTKITNKTATIMQESNEEIKKQSVSVQLLEYEKKYNETLFEILTIRNEEGWEESEELKELVKLYFILLTCLNSACRIYFTDTLLYGKLFESIFKKKVKIFISNKIHKKNTQSEYEFLNKEINSLESTELMKYWDSIKNEIK